MSLSKKILKATGVDGNKRTKDLTETELNKLRDFIEKTGYKVEGQLRQQILLNIKRLKEIGSYRGVRHIRACLFVVKEQRPTQELAEAMFVEQLVLVENHQMKKT